jgi:hypothetical protein
MDFEVAGVKRKMQLSELDEWSERAYYNSKIYKERTKRWHDKRIKKKEFAPRDKVLLFNFRVKLFGHRKLQSKWEGPFTVVSTSSHRAVTLQTDKGTLFKVNDHRLKIFLEPKQPPEVLMRWIFIFYLNYITAINRYEIYHENIIFRDRNKLETHARKVTLRR